MGEHSKAECANIRDQFASLITSVRAFLGAYKTEIATGKFTECRKLEAEINGKVEEMKNIFAVTLDTIERRLKNGEQLTKKELRYLYEVDGEIPLTTKHVKDPRVFECLSERNAVQDAEIIFEGKIARSESEITADTEAYIGPLFPGIFQRGLDNIYTQASREKIRTIELEPGSRSLEEYILALRDREEIIVHWSAESLFHSPDFDVNEGLEVSDFVRITPADLGIYGVSDLKDIYERAEMLGLELCHPVTALALCSSDDQSFVLDSSTFVASKIVNSDGERMLLSISWDFPLDDPLSQRPQQRLDTDYGQLESEWSSGLSFLFRVAK